MEREKDRWLGLETSSPSSTQHANFFFVPAPTHSHPNMFQAYHSITNSLTYAARSWSPPEAFRSKEARTSPPCG